MASFVGNTEEGNVEESHTAWFAITNKDKGLIMESGLKDWHLYGKKWGLLLDDIDVVFLVQKDIDAIREMEYILKSSSNTKICLPSSEYRGRIHAVFDKINQFGNIDYAKCLEARIIYLEDEIDVKNPHGILIEKLREMDESFFQVMAVNEDGLRELNKKEMEYVKNMLQVKWRKNRENVYADCNCYRQ